MSKRKPHTKEEAALRKQGYRLIAGADEAGKGSWAGPIVAGAVILSEDFLPLQVNDSKVLSPRQREKLFVHITQTAVSWAVGVVEPAAIDRRGITHANVAALQQALQRLHREPDAVLVDAVDLPLPPAWNRRGTRKPVKAIIDGDAKVLSIAAASIVAKVVRDALMDGQHRLFPQYGFNLHKGYGTPKHQAMLKKHGLSPIHRRSFRPMRTTPLATSRQARRLAAPPKIRRGTDRKKVARRRKKR